MQITIADELWDWQKAGGLWQHLKREIVCIGRRYTIAYARLLSTTVCYGLQPVTWKTAPRGSTECEGGCNNVGRCNYDTGYCDCAAGWTGPGCKTRQKRPCTNHFRCVDRSALLQIHWRCVNKRHTSATRRMHYMRLQLMCIGLRMGWYGDGGGHQQARTHGAQHHARTCTHTHTHTKHHCARTHFRRTPEDPSTEPRSHIGPDKRDLNWTEPGVTPSRCYGERPGAAMGRGVRRAAYDCVYL